MFIYPSARESWSVQKLVSKIKLLGKRLVLSPLWTLAVHTRREQRATRKGVRSKRVAHPRLMKFQSGRRILSSRVGVKKDCTALSLLCLSRDSATNLTRYILEEGAFLASR